jgi:hypothetical protein
LLEAWIGTLAYSMQLYFDFSGYSDMAIGLSRMFGVRLPENFASPYQARDISEFWRRWHMTLSRFLRDYLYIPLGGSRDGEWRRRRNLMVTMVLGGAWHGAAWTFLLWGALHGLFLVGHACVVGTSADFYRGAVGLGAISFSGHCVGNRALGWDGRDARTGYAARAGRHRATVDSRQRNRFAAVVSRIAVRLVRAKHAPTARTALERFAARRRRGRRLALGMRFQHEPTD